MTQPKRDETSTIWHDVPKELWTKLNAFVKGSESCGPDGPPDKIRLPTNMLVNQHETFEQLGTHKTKLWGVVENALDTKDRTLIVYLQDLKVTDPLFVRFRWWVMADTSTWQAGLGLLKVR